VEIEAPNGTFIFTGEQAERVVLVAGGVGVTPMMSVVRYLTEKKWLGRITLILSFRSPGDYIFREEIEKLKDQNSHLDVIVTMSDPAEVSWSGLRGRITSSLLAAAVQDFSTCYAHICGPVSMMESVKAALFGLGAAEVQVKTEAFGTVTRNPTAKVARSTEVSGQIWFQASNLKVPVPLDATILEVADDAGVYIDNACRSGTCASCRVKLVSGKVNMPVEDALTTQDKADGYILACQAKLLGDIAIEA
jgi:ferredoxin-NADP reductase